MMAKISKELLYLSESSPPSVKIHPCFLNSVPDAGLSFIAETDEEQLHSTASKFPNLSDDFEFFTSPFKAFIFRFLADNHHAGEFYIPKNILRQYPEVLRSSFCEDLIANNNRSKASIFLIRESRILLEECYKGDSISGFSTRMAEWMDRRGDSDDDWQERLTVSRQVRDVFFKSGL